MFVREGLLLVVAAVAGMRSAVYFIYKGHEGKGTKKKQSTKQVTA